MNSNKSEDSALPSNHSGSPVRGIQENSLAKKITPTYESTNFSAPSVDQFNGVLPEFNNRLTPERNLGLSPVGHLRLNPESHPRLVSGSCAGLSSLQSQEVLPQKLEVPVGKGLDIRPDLAGRSLAGVNACSYIGADLPIAPLGNRILTLVATEEKLKSAEEKNER